MWTEKLWFGCHTSHGHHLFLLILDSVDICVFMWNGRLCQFFSTHESFNELRLGNKWAKQHIRQTHLLPKYNLYTI